MVLVLLICKYIHIHVFCFMKYIWLYTLLSEPGHIEWWSEAMADIYPVKKHAWHKELFDNKKYQIKKYRKCWLYTDNIEFKYNGKIIIYFWDLRKKTFDFLNQVCAHLHISCNFLFFEQKFERCNCRMQILHPRFMYLYHIYVY